MYGVSLILGAGIYVIIGGVAAVVDWPAAVGI
jgi:hypothetical protein